ncbi:MAG TPA: hypothetical protein VFD49_14675 [Candidatus Dormibacteraeota bacterium]|nr:hypothetical protein [Candidatus Dormibacteraeota bacterium]
MDDAERRDLAARLARAAVARLAPEEAPLAEAGLGATPAPGGGEEVLGFGLEVALPLLTPVALAVAQEVARCVGDQLGAAVRRRRRLAGWLRRGRPDRGPRPARPPLTPAQLAEVRRLARERARALGLSESRAGALADAIVASLATDGL